MKNQKSRVTWGGESPGRYVSRNLARGVIAVMVLLVGSALAATEVGSFTAPLIATLGGTGQTGYTTGDILHATSGTAVGKLADVATGQVLTSGGVGAVPVYSASPSLTNLTLATDLTMSGATAKSFFYSDASSKLKSTSAPSNGEILIGDTGNIPAKATLTQGAGITITNAAHSITIAATGAGTRTVTAKTGDYTVLSGDSGVFFTTTGAAGAVNFTLPTAAAGLYYSFYVDAAQTLQITAGSSTTIQLGGSTTASAGNITDAVAGGCVTLIAIDSTHWKAISYTMTWTLT